MRSTLVASAFVLALGAIFFTRSVPAQPATRERATLQDTALCVERAQRETDLIPGQIRRLCIATPSASGPIDCFVAAEHTLDLTDSQEVELCRCSSGTEPVRCVQALRDRAIVTDPDVVMSCSRSIQLGLRADCTPAP